MRRTVLLTAAAATALNGLIIVAQYSAVSASGSDILLWYTIPVVLLLLIALFAVVISLPFLLFRAKRKEALELFLGATVYLAIGIGCGAIGSKVRLHAATAGGSRG
jgi:Kef-type K+ transport system membrane component KefB